ncbi:MAG: hypothetical protein AAFR70_10160, partial [Pseudomonadota bacterium]
MTGDPAAVRSHASATLACAGSGLSAAPLCCPRAALRSCSLPQIGRTPDARHATAFAPASFRRALVGPLPLALLSCGPRSRLTLSLRALSQTLFRPPCKLRSTSGALAVSPSS